MGNINFLNSGGYIGLTGSTYLTIIPDQIITGSYYKYDSNLTDSGSAGYNGTSGSTTSYIQGNIWTNSLKISGTTSAVSYGNKVIPSGQKNIAFWIYELGTSATYGTILSNNYIFGTSTGTTIYYNSDANYIYYYFQIRGGGADASTYGLFEYFSYVEKTKLPGWFHFVFQWDGTSNANGVKTYRNGVLLTQTTNTKSEGPLASYNLSVGSGALNSANAYFYIQDLIIESTIWSAAKVLSYYNAYKPI